ncbi:MAG: hypothetical protein RL150_201 [Candidatus Parcubacteria bacterium]|jgi:glutaredoxin
MGFIVYTKTGCPWCIAVTDFLKTTSLAYEERNVSENPAFFAEMQEKSGQGKTPTFDFDDTIYGDSDVDELKRILVERGLHA